MHRISSDDVNATTVATSVLPSHMCEFEFASVSS